MEGNKNVVPVMLAIFLIVLIAGMTMVCYMIYKIKVPTIPAPVNNVYIITETGGKDSVKVVSIPIQTPSQKRRTCSHIVQQNKNTQVLNIQTKDTVSVKVITQE